MVLIPDFNSIKVRLKLSISEVVSTATTFQFHKGTIKTVERVARFAALLSFQFHKGTIKTGGGLVGVVRVG